LWSQKTSNHPSRVVRITRPKGKGCNWRLMRWSS
jgi:hypothetical protein